MRILICGGRDFTDSRRFELVMNELDWRLGPFTVIIHGAARGADTEAGLWAAAKGREERRYPADWDRHGRRAGSLRNQQMLDEERPELVVAFPGGPGTADMVRRARAAGLRVEEPLMKKPPSQEAGGKV